jgi:hypothetical protein
MAEKGTCVRWKTRYKSKAVKGIERYDKWQSRFPSLFNLEKIPVPSFCYFCELFHCFVIPLLGCLFTVTIYKFETTATILIANILLI